MLSKVLNQLSTAIEKPYRLTNVEDNNNQTINILVLYLNHIDANVLISQSMQSKLNTLTPVNASSLYWLI